MYVCWLYIYIYIHYIYIFEQRNSPKSDWQIYENIIMTFNTNKMCVCVLYRKNGTEKAKFNGIGDTSNSAQAYNACTFNNNRISHKNLLNNDSRDMLTRFTHYTRPSEEKKIHASIFCRSFPWSAHLIWLTFYVHKDKAPIFHILSQYINK